MSSSYINIRWQFDSEVMHAYAALIFVFKIQNMYFQKNLSNLQKKKFK